VVAVSVLLAQNFFLNMNDKFLGQRININFLLMEENVIDIYIISQQAYGEVTVGRTYIFVWFNQFQDRREDVTCA
jgi:hypothetical protein